MVERVADHEREEETDDLLATVLGGSEDEDGVNRLLGEEPLHQLHEGGVVIHAPEANHRVIW